MASCEMCGRDELLSLAQVEGVGLQICSRCSRYGVAQQNVRSGSSLQTAGSQNSFSPSSRGGRIKPEREFKVVENYASLLRAVRERKGLTQKDFALSLQEKESFIGKWETGAVKPDLETAKRLERLLGVTLVQIDDAPLAAEGMQKQKNTEFTLGDFIKVRKR